MTEVDLDEIRNVSTHCQIYGKPRVLGAHVYTGSLKQQPHQTESAPVRRHARELETNHDTVVRERISIGSLAEAPQQDGWIEIVAFQAIAPMHQSPMSEFADD